jgi:hypothetical protein
MKTYLAIALGFACFSPASSLIAADGTVRAAVVAQNINAELRNSESARSAGRESFNVGEVHEIIATTGKYEELKVDATQTALVPTSSLRIRTCTRSELSEAQEKFNVLTAENQRKARKEISTVKKQALADAGALASSCPTCPKVQQAARERAGAAKKAYSKELKALRLRMKNLAVEALAWAGVSPSASTAAQ